MNRLLVRQADFGYTPAMHSIDRKWTDLAAGYQAIQSFKIKLSGEFGRAVRVGHKQQYHKELSEWQKKRRVFFSLAAIAPLSIIALCLTSFYFREVACVIVYWAVLVLIILGTLGVAGRQYIQEMVNGKPVLQPEDGLVVDLEGRWWESLSPQDRPLEKEDRKEEADFLALLGSSLADAYSAKYISNSEVLLLGPAGMWIFKVEYWSGTICKQEDAWIQRETTSRAGTRTLRSNKQGGKQPEEKTHKPGPDDLWLTQKHEIEILLEKNLPERSWILNHLQGGVVFAHPKVKLDKKHIQGNSASYGLPKAWTKRILLSAQVDGFTLEMQLEIMDALAETGAGQTQSARDEAERLYQGCVLELHETVTKMVK
jgi:hypothetical protein